MKDTDWRHYKKLSLIKALVLTCLLLSVLGLHWYIGLKLTRSTAPLVHASIDLKYQLTSFHLFLEELIQGDQTIPKKQVWQFLQNAMWHVQAMLVGGSNEDGTYVPLTDESARLLLKTTEQSLQRLHDLALSRLENHAVVDSQADLEFNLLFSHVIEITDQIHQVIHREIHHLEDQYQWVGIGLASLLIVLGMGVWWSLNVKEAQRRAFERRTVRLARIVEHSVNEIYFFTADSLRFSMVNESSCRNLQFSLDELLNMTLLEIMPEYSLERFRKRLQPLLDQTRPFIQFETRQVRKDGTSYDVSINLQYIADEEPAQLVAFVKDITREKQVRQNLSLHDTAMKAAANTIVITDRQGIIEWANPAFTKSTGYTLEEAIGQNPRILKSGQQDAPFYRNLWDTILAGEVWQGVFVNQRKDGTLVHEEATITPVMNQAGHITHFIAIKQDITKRLMIEQELQEAKQKAEAASQAKSDFLATMSHEIRTPLNVVLGILELLKESDLEAVYQEQIKLAMGSGKMLLYLINDILDYSKIEANQLELDTIDFNLRTLLDDIAVSMAPLAHVKNVELTGFFPQESPVDMRGDPNRLRQIFTNLLSNAIKFTPKGGVVEFHGGPVSRTGQVIEFLFEIRDTGMGIPLAEREHIFERFVQANTSTTRQHGGTGLGLAICQRLVHLMHGSIGVDDNVFAPSGSVFYFTIQLLEQKSILSIRQQTAPTGLQRVLIVGSHGLQLALLRNALHVWKIHFDEINLLRTAVERVADASKCKDPYQVVIINQWPGQNRPPELNELVDLHTGVRFLLLIDRLDQGADQAVELPGETVCLKKPFSVEQLHVALSRLLHLDHEISTGGTVAPVFISPPKERVAKLLIVDDQPANLTVTLGMLGKIGYERSCCLTAANGQLAVELFKNNSCDLVLMDCQMPVMDGYMATQAIREWERQQGRPPVPVIALTADVTQLNRITGQRAGMNDFLAKPVSMDELRQKLDHYLPLTQITIPAPAKLSPRHAGSVTAEIQIILSALHTLGLRKEDLPGIARLITEQLPELMSSMERDLRAARYEQVRATAHVLRGSMIHTVFPEMQKQTRLLHEAVRNQVWSEAEEQLAKVQAVFHPIHHSLNAWLAQQQSP